MQCCVLRPVASTMEMFGYKTEFASTVVVCAQNVLHCYEKKYILFYKLHDCRIHVLVFFLLFSGFRYRVIALYIHVAECHNAVVIKRLL